MTVDGERKKAGRFIKTTRVPQALVLHHVKAVSIRGEGWDVFSEDQLCQKLSQDHLLHSITRRTQLSLGAKIDYEALATDSLLCVVLHHSQHDSSGSVAGLDACVTVFFFVVVGFLRDVFTWILHALFTVWIMETTSNIHYAFKKFVVGEILLLTKAAFIWSKMSYYLN